MTAPITTFGSVDATRPGTRDRLDAARGLVRAVRRLMRAATTTALEPAEIAVAEAAIDAVSARLEERVRPRALRIALDDAATASIRDGNTWEHFAFNPLGIPLRIRLDGDILRARLQLEPHHEGPPGLLHGGFSAALMDALLGTLVQVHGILAVTAGLELRFRRGVPVEALVDLGGRVLGVDGRKISVEGWIDLEGERCVEARGLFVSVDRETG